MPSIADIQAAYAAGQELQRKVRMQRAWQTYYGDTPRPLKVRPGEPDDTVRLNFARLVVDKGVSVLLGGGVRFVAEGLQTNTDHTDATDRGGSGIPESDPSDPSDPSYLRADGRPTAQGWLDRVWQANHQATLLHKLAVNGGVCGHAWVKIAPGGPEGLPRVIAVDPQRVSVLWEPDDFEQVAEFRLEWHGIDPRTGRPAAFRQTISRLGFAPAAPSAIDQHPPTAWTVTDEMSEGDRSGWTTVASERWPWSWPPLIGCQNLPAPNEYWGMSDLEDDLLDVLRAINLTMSSISRILKYHAHPKTWLKGAGPRDVTLAVDGLICLPTVDAEIGSLEMQSDLGSSLEFYKRLKEALHEMARIPEVATGRVEHLGALSGTALGVLYQPLTEKTQTKRLLYGDMLVELNRRLLEMGGHAGARVSVEWPDLVKAAGEG